MADAPTTGKRIIDVAHPNKTAPPTNSKSVIITHHPVMQDPMVVESSGNNAVSEATDAQPAEASAAAPHTKLVLQPLSTLSTPSTDEVAGEESFAKDTEGEPEPETKPAEPPAAPADKPEEKREVGDIGAPNSDAAIDAEQEAQKKAEDALQKLIDDKQYFVPINSLEKQRTKRTFILGVLLSIILAAAWVDIALDAGLVHLGNIQALTNFF